MDGTLVDTEPFWIECEGALVEEHGGTWTSADAMSIVGFDLIDAANVLRGRGGVRMEPVDIVDHLLDCVIGRIRDHVPWRPGAAELLADCRRAGIPTGLVTMSWQRFADAVVVAAPAGSFQTVVTGDAVSRGKPDPEPYLKAAADLGVPPQDCVAIEDSPTGVAAALAAGCRTIGVPHAVPLDEDTPGLTIVRSLAGIGVEELEALVA
jgi:HAD superfamily hydrolase (TIGR01509 family)